MLLNIWFVYCMCNNTQSKGVYRTPKTETKNKDFRMHEKNVRI